MKKILLFSLLAVILCTAVFAAQPGYLFAPSDLNRVEYSNLSNDCILQYGDRYLKIVTVEGPAEGTNGDPFIVVDTALDAKYEWIKLRIKNMSDAKMFEMHFASDATGGSIAAEACTHFPISARDTEYKEYIFNVKEYNLASQNVNADVKLSESAWSGNISKVRFDSMWIGEPSGQMPKGSEMEIDYIAFFDSKEAAEAYVLPEKAVKQPIQAAESWDAASPNFIFDNADEVSKWVPVGVSVQYELGNMKIVPTSVDPQMTRSFETPFAANDYPYFALRYKAHTTIPNGGFFFITDEVTGFSGVTYTNYDIDISNKWTNVIMDMREQEHGNWRTNIHHIRLDAVNGTKDDGDTQMYINRMGFFKSAEEAMAFLSEGGGDDFSKTTVFTDIDYKTIIPGGTVTDSINKNEFLLQNTQADKNSVVTYTDANGKQNIVALSYTNDYGYTSYVANKPGTYAIGANHKDYVDIAGHWGEGYINFVSDRALFGGTSPTEFSPEVTMTRGMFITVLGRMHGLDTSKYDGNTGYGDVPAGEYYAPYIQWAKAEGIMAGLSDVTFAPEDPITRATMAVVIKNYIDNSGFEFTAYSETEGFNDLAGLDEATVNAINSVKNVGIINGKGAGKFDPNGVSTRAEVATVMERVIKAVLGVNVPVGSYTNEYITRDRIRLGVWSFEGAFATEKGMKELRDLGVDVILNGSATASASTRDTVLNYADVYGIEVYMTDYYQYEKDYVNVPSVIENSDPVKVASGYSYHPSFAGHYITDEPGTDNFPLVGSLTDDYEAQMPGKRAYSNLLPMYANAAQLKYGAGAAAIEYYDSDPDLYRKYCQEWFNNTSTDYICVDIYPFNWEGTFKTTYRDYVESINQVATVAREAGKEFWCCIQTYGWQANKRTPNESEYRWQCYCLLSFGCTGIMLWQYRSNPEFPALVDVGTLEPTQAYYDCQPVMWEMRALSDTFIQYKNLGAFTHNAAASYQKMSGEYTGFDTIKSVTSDNSLLIGCFEKKDGSGATAFTVVNMEEFYSEASASAVIGVDPAKKVTVYEMGKPVEVVNDGTIELMLECGQGVFVTVE
ncbi:MAG: S-layer homology domain-containing protein [Ruminococcaceae bacterium]|nr:S-layer homology domain-containing protein [Oscillospiraceae bacterium]